MATTGAVAIPLVPDLANVAADTNAETGPQEGENTYRWAAVTSVSPLRIQLDGETAAMPITPDCLIPIAKLAAATRVWVQLFGRRVLILGAANGGVPDPPAPPIGSILAWGGSAAPTNYMLCNGASLDRTVYALLFAVVGTTYGSVDGTHFNLPLMTNRVPVGAGGTYARGATGGAVTVVLTDANLSSHEHSVSVNLSGGTAGSVADHSHSISGTATDNGTHNHGYVQPTSGAIGVVADGATSYAQVGGGTVTGSAGGHNHSLSGSIGNGGGHSHSLSGTINVNTGTIGSDSAHENMPPYLASTFIIRVT